jgi:hypothetical protein
MPSRRKHEFVQIDTLDGDDAIVAVAHVAAVRFGGRRLEQPAIEACLSGGHSLWQRDTKERRQWWDMLLMGSGDG